MAKKNEMVSKSTYDRMKADFSSQLTKVKGKLKAADEGADWGAGPEAGLSALAIGSTHAILSRWKVATPIPLAGFESIAPASVAFTAAWPLFRKGLSKSIRKHGDELWRYGLARVGEDLTTRGISALLD